MGDSRTCAFSNREQLAFTSRPAKGTKVHDGLYESLVTARLLRELSLIVDREPVTSNIDDAEAPEILGRHIADLVSRRVRETRDPEARLALVRHVIETLDAPDEDVEAPARQLVSILPKAAPGITPIRGRPSIPLSDAALLTNAGDEPSLGAELRAEIASANEIDLLCAFVKWHGLRILEDDLTSARDRHAPLRVITTTYMGATERRALDRLVRDFGSQVRVQYDAHRTRLHAKAWMFRRLTGFDTAYVGSSNLSRAALLDGVEWNVRLSAVGTPSLLHKFRATFDTYWNDSSFEPYDPDRDRDRLDDALAEASGRTSHDRVTVTLAGLEVRPFAYQQEILDAVEAERAVHDRHRNLIVAATGTGKTVIAALDYRRLCASPTDRPTLLFIAHRQEILNQSMRTYREVLSDGDFGETYVGGTRPERWQHVFASVQSLNSYGITSIPPDAFDIVVIDEFHHAEAASYRRILDHLQPRELLGLTATPERADGADVRSFFGGRTAAELRLWDALGADLLCPFHYFAVADGTDLRGVTWTRGRYDEAQLSNLYTGNRVRAAMVISELRDKVIDPGAMRALGFCVSVDHADFMAEVFREAGIPAAAVNGGTPQPERERALDDLRHRRINALFAVDVFNEGLDIPDVDTVLFLRPTESATVFLQQLGRGLRRTQDKAVLTVLDFVGYQNKHFRWDHKLRALTGSTRRGLERDIERGFPFLPSGCQIVLDKQAQAVVLDNLRSQVASRWAQIVAELRSYGDQDLPEFLDESGIELSDILRRGSHSWTRLRREAGLPTRPGSDLEEKLLRRVRAFAHVDDRGRAATYAHLLGDSAPAYADLAPDEQRMARMLLFSLWPDGGGFESIQEGLQALRDERAARDELRSVVDISFDAARHLTLDLTGEVAGVPLKVHARYQREEILAALDFPRNPNSMREGVWYSRDKNIDAFLITLKKSESDYSPTTMYRDYPISRTLFHWESQSTTSLASETGRRYVAGSSTVLLFARIEAKDEFGTAPYLFLGPGRYVSHEGERPIAITWRLDHPLPSDFFAVATVAAG
jgi:superfamily II DNA or RNA helicase/HKD family nuclease